VYRGRYESHRSSKPKSALKKTKYGENDFQYGGWNSYTVQYGTIMTLISPRDGILQCGLWPTLPGIMTVNSPSGSTLQCDTWLWGDMPLNSPKRLPYRNSTSGFDFDNITVIDVLLHLSAKFYPYRTTSAEKNDVMSIFKMADLSHLEF